MVVGPRVCPQPRGLRKAGVAFYPVAMGGQEKLDRYEEQIKCLEAQVIYMNFQKISM